MKGIYKLLFVVIFIFFIGNIYKVNINVKAEEFYEKKIYSNATINDKFSSDSLLVLLNEEASNSNKKYTVDDFENVKCSNVIDLTEGKFEKIKSLDNEVEDFKRILCLELKESSKEYVLEAIDELMKRDDVLYAGPDYEIKSASIIPSDYNASTQWAIDNIDLPEVWDFSTGTHNVVVGVIDSGIDGNHPDLRESIVNNECRDFSQGYEQEVSVPIDPWGHGTQVAGIIGAIGNNGIGCVGVNWNVSLVSLRVLDNYGQGKSSYAIKAIDYAEIKRIPIINISITWYENSYYDAAFDYIISQYSGLVICSAGNEGLNNDVINAYPANTNLPNVISVGAHDKDNQRSIWSNYKSSNYGADSVHIYAPGGKGDDRQSVDNCLTIAKNNSYEYFSGTSCAAPYVTGVAALLLSINEILSVDQLKNAILNSAETINITLPDGTIQNVKKLNAFNALKYIFDNYPQSEFGLNSGGLRVQKTIYPGDSYFHTEKMFIKLNVRESFDYTFEIYGNYPINVKIYDSNLNEVPINLTYMDSNSRITFTENLSIGEYFLLVDGSSSETQIINLIILSAHAHSYTRYRPYNVTQHKAICSCGTSILQYHILEDNGCCVLCLAIVSSSIHSLSLNNINYITENGSYKLPNGVIILVEADMDVLFKKTEICYF